MIVAPFGDAALRFDLAEGEDHRALLAELRAERDVVDVVLTERAGAVYAAPGTSLGDLAARVEARLGRSRAAPSSTAPRAAHVVRAVYDGPDLDAIAAAAGVARADVARVHAGRAYDVAMLGFLPGFAYLRGIDPRLALARRASPRPAVPAGSVAIAAGYTGIYPFASPGGWHLLGRAVGFDAFGADGAALALGDRVRFEPIAPRDAPPDRPTPPPSPSKAPAGPHLEVTRAQGLALLVDAGRRGHMHEGVPPGGALDAATFVRANAACENAPGACAIEVAGAIELVARGGRVRVATSVRGSPASAVWLRDGERLVASSGGAARACYVAVAGGFDVPIVLDGRGTLLVARLGGLEGRALRRGDRLVPSESSNAAHAPRTPSSQPHTPDDAPFPVALGPDHDLAGGAALDALRTGTFVISSSSDRTGTRLEGPLAPAGDRAALERPSSPMTVGAIEATPRGLIVLGPDHPTTGGYPVVAVLRHDALSRFFSRPLGSRVTFSP